MIPVTRTFLPSLDKYQRYTAEIFGRGHITNHGPLKNELESILREYFNVKHFFLVTNGTIGLQIAIKAANLQGEVITTPFSYIATTSSLFWEGGTPVFADILPDEYNINPEAITKLISPETSGILATHVFGNPCRINELQELAAKNGLKLIFDAAHTFGAKWNDSHLMQFGDISVISFHATKLFHTVQGGGIATNDDELAEKIRQMKNCGHDRFTNISGPGINAECSEFQAAMGLCVLPEVDNIMYQRSLVIDNYKNQLASLGDSIKFQRFNPSLTQANHAYFSVKFQTIEIREKVITALNSKDVFPRRYFSPSLNKLNYISGNQSCPVSEDLASTILCLPLFVGLSGEEVTMICDTIKSVL